VSVRIKNYRERKSCCSCKYATLLMGIELRLYCSPTEGKDRVYCTDEDTPIRSTGICDNHTLQKG